MKLQTVTFFFPPPVNKITLFLRIRIRYFKGEISEFNLFFASHENILFLINIFYSYPTNTTP